MKLKDGKTLFKTLKVGLSCETCIQKCIPCTHKIRNLPSWKSTERQAKTEAIMATRSDQMNRELMGNIASSSRDYFLKKFVTPFRERLPYIFDECVNVIYTAIDPSGGSTSSDYAICSMAIENSQRVILSMDISSSFKHNEVRQMLHDHIMKLREIRTFSNAVIFMAIEANMSYLCCDDLAHYFQSQSKFGEIHVLSQDPKNLQRYGIWTDENAKQQYANDLQQVLSDGVLHWSHTFQSERGEGMKRELYKQIENYRRETKENKDPVFGQIKYTFTGKTASQRDDAILALQICLTQTNKLRYDAAFMQYCHSNGLRY